MILLLYVSDDDDESFDLRLAVSFLCVIERRRGVVLGMERIWPSDAILVDLMFDGAGVCCGGGCCVWLTR